MVRREERDTTKGGDKNAIGVIKTLSNDVLFGFFNDEKIVKIVENIYDIALNAQKDADRLNASREILDRVLGKPKQTIEGTLKTPIGADDQEVKNILEKYGVVQRLQESGGESTD